MMVVLRFFDNPLSIPETAAVCALEFAHRSTSRFQLPTNAIILDIPTGRVLIGTGILAHVNEPFFENTGLLIPSMIAASITLESIGSTLITHGHQDHFGSLIDKD